MIATSIGQPIGLRRTHRRGYGQHGAATPGPVCALVAQEPGLPHAWDAHHIQLLPALPLPVQPLCPAPLSELDDVAPILLTPIPWPENYNQDAQRPHQQLGDQLHGSALHGVHSAQPAYTVVDTGASAEHSIRGIPAEHSSSLRRTGTKLGQQLAAQISAVNSLQELQQLHGKEGQQWDAVHVVAALSKAAKASELVKCAQPEPPSWALPMLATLLLQATQHTQRGRYAPRQLTSLLWAVAKLQLWQQTAGVQLLAAVSDALCTQLCQRQAGKHNHKQACSHTAHQAKNGKNRQYSRHQPHISALDISNSAWALVRLGIALPGCRQRLQVPEQLPREAAGKLQSLWQQLLRHIPGKSAGMGAQEVSNVMWALAHAGATMPALPAHNAAGTVMPTLPAQNDTVMRTLPAHDNAADLAHHDISHDTHVHSAHNDRHHELQGLQADIVAAVTALSARAVQASAQLDRQHVPNIAWACAVMRHSDAALLDAVAHRALHVSILRSLTAQGLSVLAWAYASLRYPHTSLLAGIQRCATWKVRKFRLQGLANLQWGVATLTSLQQHAGTASWQYSTSSSIYDAGLSGHSSSSNSSGVPTAMEQHTISMQNTNSAHAAHSGMSLMSLIAREAIYKMEEAQPLSLATLLQVWANSGYYNVSLFTSAVERARQLLHSFFPHTLVTLLAAISRVGHTDLPFMEAAAVQLLPWIRDSHVHGMQHGICSTADGGRSNSSSSSHQSCSLEQALQLASAYGSHHYRFSQPTAALLRALAPQIVEALKTRCLDAPQVAKLPVAYAQAGVQTFPTNTTKQNIQGMDVSHQQHASSDQLTADKDAQEAVALRSMLQLLCTQLQEHVAHMNAAQLAAATWAMVAMQVPHANNLVCACADHVSVSPLALGRFCGSVKPRWRVRLAWAMAQNASSTIACMGLHMDKQQQQQQGHEEVLSASTQVSVARQLADSLQDELHLLDVSTLLQLMHVLQLTAAQLTCGPAATPSHGPAFAPTQAASNASTAPAATAATTANARAAGAPSSATASSIDTNGAYMRLLVHELGDRFTGMAPWLVLSHVAQLPSGMHAPVDSIVRQHATRFLAWAAAGSNAVVSHNRNAAPAGRQHVQAHHSHRRSSGRAHYSNSKKGKGPAMHARRGGNGKAVADVQRTRASQFIPVGDGSSGSTMSAADATAARLSALLQGWQALEALMTTDTAAVDRLAAAVLQATTAVLLTARRNASSAAAYTAARTGQDSVWVVTALVQAAKGQLAAAAAVQPQLQPMLLQLEELARVQLQPMTLAPTAAAAAATSIPQQPSPARAAVLTQVYTHVGPAGMRQLGPHTATPDVAAGTFLWPHNDNNSHTQTPSQTLLPKPKRQAFS